jgi:hypothetical protein
VPPELGRADRRGGTTRAPAGERARRRRAAPDAPPSCIGDAAPFDPEVLRARLAFLASPELDGRAPGTAGDDAARAHVVERFRCLGLETSEQPFDDTANVIGIVRGGDEIVVVGAHRDHLGTVDGKHFLGANDNASGTTALLAVAQAIQQRGTAPARTIVFVSFGAEERGELGSQYFAAHPPIDLAAVVYMVNLDMVGSYRSSDIVAALGSFGKLPGRRILERLDDAYPKLHVGYGGRGVGSDHEPFCKLGIPYIFFWTPDASCYHKPCDTVDRIDLPHMAQIAALAGALVGELADTELDLAASRAKLGCYGR